MGSGTTALVAQRLGRHFLGCDINAEYVALANKRLHYAGDDKRMMQEEKTGNMQLKLFES
jgi:DNA modification methylase